MSAVRLCSTHSRYGPRAVACETGGDVANRTVNIDCVTTHSTRPLTRIHPPTHRTHTLWEITNDAEPSFQNTARHHSQFSATAPSRPGTTQPITQPNQRRHHPQHLVGNLHPCLYNHGSRARVNFDSSVVQNHHTSSTTITSAMHCRVSILHSRPTREALDYCGTTGVWQDSPTCMLFNPGVRPAHTQPGSRGYREHACG